MARASRQSASLGFVDGRTRTRFSRSSGLSRILALSGMLVAAAAVPAPAAETLNAYSIWPENWARPMFEEFEKATGIKVNFVLALWASGVLAQPAGPAVHGADAVFAGPGLAIAWAVLRTPDEAGTLVVIRVVALDPGYRSVAVEGVDPFTGARRRVLPREALRGALDVRSPRALFGDWPRREIQLYRETPAELAGPPALTVYYLGVPDTTPEFRSEADLQAYLADAIARVAPGR